MTLDAEQCSETIQDLLDDALGSRERDRLEAHLLVCESCRRELASAQWVRKLVHQWSPTEEVAPTLVQAMLDEEDGPSRQPFPLRSRWMLKPVILALAAVLAVAVGIGLWFNRSPDIPDSVAQLYQQYQAAELPLDFETEDARALQGYFAGRGILFNQVNDLTDKRIDLIGGGTPKLGPSLSTLAVYRNAEGRILVCFMYEGSVRSLPAEREVRRLRDIDFYVYRRDGITMVFWQAGGESCVFASDLSSETVVQLAAEKAVAML